MKSGRSAPWQPCTSWRLISTEEPGHDEYILSSKVGKLLKASRHNDAKWNFPFSPSPNNVVFDYTGDGVRRSVEDSLQRLGARSEEQVLANVTSMQARIPPEFWAELKRQGRIEQNAPTPA